MKTSDIGRKKLEDREGRKNNSYYDTKGIPTIGIGHTSDIYLKVVVPMYITDEKIDQLLALDLLPCEHILNAYVKVPLMQHQFDALVSFIFNIGVGAFLKSTMLKKLNANDFDGAAEEFDKWVIPPEIKGRRMSEKDQFLTQESL